MVTPSAEEFLDQRPRLFSLAYRMLGEAGEAEDVVQDAYLRWAGAARAEIAYPPAWLTKVVTNLCLNRLTSERARRETYVGSWLPEPVLTADGALDPLGTVEQRDSVSLALLRLMERLTPTERAVFSYCGRRSPTAIGRSPGFSTSRRPTPGSFMAEPASVSVPRARDSSLTEPSGTGSSSASWRQPRAATRPSSASCWLQMRPPRPTAAAKSAPPDERSSGATGSPATSPVC